MKMALNMAEISNGVRAKVGAILVTKNGVVLTGVNGLPKPLGNELEYPEYQLVSEFGKSAEVLFTGLTTKSTVIHAELNCILKAAREGVSTVGSTIYVTLSPCSQCAAMLASAGVSRVVYLSKYRLPDGLKVLEECGLEVVQLRLEDEI